jgi:hypothetical protein
LPTVALAFPAVEEALPDTVAAEPAMPAIGTTPQGPDVPEVAAIADTPLEGDPAPEHRSDAPRPTPTASASVQSPPVPAEAEPAPPPAARADDSVPREATKVETPRAASEKLPDPVVASGTKPAAAPAPTPQQAEPKSDRREAAAPDPVAVDQTTDAPTRSESRQATAAATATSTVAAAGEPRPASGLAAVSEAAAPEGPRADWRLTAPEPTQQSVRATVETPRALPPVAPQALAGQITLAVGRATTDRSVEIRLDPPELGRVQINLRPTETGLQATVLAERPETHDLLRRHADLLARDLGAAGFRDVSLDFAAGGQTAPGRDEARAAIVAANAAADVPPEAAVRPAPVRRDVVAGGLDIRL